MHTYNRSCVRISVIQKPGHRMRDSCSTSLSGATHLATSTKYEHIKYSSRKDITKGNRKSCGPIWLTMTVVVCGRAWQDLRCVALGLLTDAWAHCYDPLLAGRSISRALRRCFLLYIFSLSTAVLVHEDFEVHTSCREVLGWFVVSRWCARMWNCILGRLRGGCLRTSGSCKRSN